MAQRLTNHEERFTARVTIGSPEQCWLWEGQILAHTGYGQFWPHGRAGGKVYAHRYAYERWIGPVPDGLTLDHLCHTRDLTCPGGSECLHRRCVNPYHLEPVTESVQQRRRRHWRQIDDGSWVCAEGHPIDEDDLAEKGICRTCFNEYKRRWRKEHHERPTPAARERYNAKRRATRTVEKTKAATEYAANRRLRLFLEQHPELVHEVDAIGIQACAQRLRRGWWFIDGQWLQPV